MNNLKRTLIIGSLIIIATQSSYAGWFGFSWPFKKKEATVQVQTELTTKQQPATTSKPVTQKPGKSTTTTPTPVIKTTDTKTPTAKILPAQTATTKQPAVVAVPVTGTAAVKPALETKTTSTSNKDVTLTVITTSGGYVLSTENDITCYDDSKCVKTFPVNKKVKLQATPKEGYSVQGWSEASCGAEKTCIVPLLGDTTVYARFEVTKKFKVTGEIKSPENAKETCYIPQGSSDCSLRFTWVNNSTLGMTISLDGEEYVVSSRDPNSNSISKPADADPVDVAKAEKENVSGMVYFDLSPAVHKIELKTQGTVLDSVTVDVKCAPGTYWTNNMCWVKDGKRLYTFKVNGAVIKTSPEGLNCGGYIPEKCLTVFAPNTSVTITADVKDGYTFDSWTGDCSGTKPTCTLIMMKDSTVGVKMK